MNIGYVIHIENSLNMDIDFNLPEGELTKGFFLEYTYTDDIKYRTGKAYRSHLKGIALKKNSNSNAILNNANMHFKNIINRCGGFVKYNIDSIDIFNRVIVTLYDPISEECINNILLRPEYSTVFEAY